MAQVLDVILTVSNLAAGASITKAHGLQTSGGVKLIPWGVVANPGNSPIGVSAADDTNITFVNNGNNPETAIFWVHYPHSDQGFPNGSNFFHTGPSSLSSLLLANPMWDDIRIGALDIQAYGANAPALVRIGGIAGSAPPLSAISLTGTSNAVAGADFGDFSASYSVMMWFNTAYTAATQHYLIDKFHCFSITLTSQHVRVNIDGLTSVTTAASYLANAKNFLVVNVTAGSPASIEIYLNGTLVTTQLLSGSLPVDTADLVYLGVQHNGANNLTAVIDELRFYQAVLSQAQVTQLWAAGTGISTEPTGAPTLLAGYHFDDGAGSVASNYQGNATLNISLTNFSWVAGLVNAVSSTGVFAYEFIHGTNQELFCMRELPHGWKLGSLISPHVHWINDSGSGGNVLWQLEYRIIETGIVAGNTTIIQVADAAGSVAQQGKYSEWADIDMTGHGLSSIIQFRVSRQGLDPLDTAANVNAWLLMVDFHYQIDTLGSRQELVK